jgi:hypothetical protein
MNSRSTIAWHEYQNPEEYLLYYEEQATLKQALLYVAYGLRPMSDKWHRIKRKTQVYNVKKSKDAKVVHAKSLLLIALLGNILKAYGQKGIGKAVEYTDKWVYSPFQLYLSPEHEAEHSLIPTKFWDSVQVNFDENYVFIPDHLSYINVEIPTDKLLELFPFEYSPPVATSALFASSKAQVKYIHNEEVEFFLFATRFFFSTENLSHTKSSKGMAAKLQTKYLELTGRKMSDNKAKVLTSVLKNEYNNEKIIRKIKIS